VVAVSGKGSGRVSVAGIVCLKPGSRGRLFYRVLVHRGRKGERRSFSEAHYAGLIAAAHHQLHAPVILVWDNLNTHVSAAMRDLIATHSDWLTVVRLPQGSGVFPTCPVVSGYVAGGLIRAVCRHGHAT
jgi:putative transposase